MKERLANLATLVMVLCALTVAGTVVYRQVSPASASTGPATIKVRDVPDWERYAAQGRRIGAAGTPVTIVEFSDYQCPFCAIAHRALTEVLRDRPGDVSVVFRHFPLTGHDYARPAALAAECAAEQGAFAPFSDLLFQKQDSIGVLGWDVFAARAGVRDGAAFDRCVRGREQRARVDADLAAARELDLTGTPTFLVEGKLFRGTLSADSWKQILDQIMAARAEPRAAGG